MTGKQWLLLSLATLPLMFMGGSAKSSPAAPSPGPSPKPSPKPSAPKPPNTTSASSIVTSAGTPYEVVRVSNTTDPSIADIVYVSVVKNGDTLAMRGYQGDHSVSSYVNSSGGDEAEAAFAKLVEDVKREPGNFGVTYEAGGS
jgi:hypothetical protein